MEEIQKKILKDNFTFLQFFNMTDQKEDIVDKQKEITIDDLEIYRPINGNINYHGEWLFKIWQLVYGIMVRKTDNKMLVTYNIDPDNINSEYFMLIDESLVPSKVYKLFMQKLNTDIARLDSMMFNLIKNKSLLSLLFNFSEAHKDKWADADFEIIEYTEEDANNDKKLEALKAQNQRKIMVNSMKKKNKRKAVKKSRKANRKK